MVDGLPDIPPLLPIDAPYTQNYCEENIYLLAQQFEQQTHVRDVWDISVVFISNHTKSVALWMQKAATNHVVVWDYHVILILRCRISGTSAGSADRECQADGDHINTTIGGSWIYDFDSKLPMPCSSGDYLSETFDLSVTLPESYHSLFKVVPASEVLDWFASDRSHMISPITHNDQPVNLAPETESSRAEYRSPPPPYPFLCGAKAKENGIGNNLADFVRMDLPQGFGSVLSLTKFKKWCF
ncbi:hypothetical protein HETIRDRAFT_407495 [Heterobasidion irregulare TC 32-1]|uniref:Protein N-terminal glutamine amidohydrolase n=1 Tax=Heterobasidion irregulare (strain TC 32-1) TaxID=747525 RepID=W4KHZ2_HETIT|nr:uncharacterized protein HETIRDRAFT_407495 [Heterobasidion irregulare TC 32-1]ETW85462.1 hypothetical protein HETIRDRAFT_407495 [Heterobasidion irregulare TC 32-1]